MQQCSIKASICLEATLKREYNSNYFICRKESSLELVIDINPNSDVRNAHGVIEVFFLPLLFCREQSFQKRCLRKLVMSTIIKSISVVTKTQFLWVF